MRALETRVVLVEVVRYGQTLKECEYREDRNADNWTLPVTEREESKKIA